MNFIGVAEDTEGFGRREEKAIYICIGVYMKF